MIQGLSEVIEYMEDTWKIRQTNSGQVFELSSITLQKQVLRGKLSSDDEFFDNRSRKWKKLDAADGPIDASTIYQMVYEAEKSYQQYDVAKAQKLLKSSLDFRPYAPAFFLMGVIEAQKTGEANHRALDAFRRSLECAECYKTPVIYNNIGVLLALENESSGALCWFEKAGQSMPLIAEPHYNLSLLYKWWRKTGFRRDKDYRTLWETELRIAYDLDCSSATDHNALLLYDEDLLMKGI